MNKNFSVFIIIFPYLLSLLTYVIFNEGKTMVLDNDNLITFVIVAVVLIIIFLIIYLKTLISMILKWDLKTTSFFNLLVKIAYVPIHSILFFIMGAMGNPFLLILMPIPFVVSIIFMGITGTLSMALIIRMYRTENLKLCQIGLYSLLSYCYIADIIIAIILYIKQYKTKDNILN